MAEELLMNCDDEQEMEELKDECMRELTAANYK